MRRAREGGGSRPKGRGKTRQPKPYEEGKMSMQQAIAIGGAETIEPSAVEALRTTLRGAVLVPAEGAIRSRNPASRRNSARIGEPPCGL